MSHLPGIDTVVLARTEDMSAHRAAVAAALDLVQPDVVESSTWEAETLHYLHTPPTRRAPVLIRGDVSAATMTSDRALIAAEQDLLAVADSGPDDIVAVSDYAAADLAAAYRIPRPPVLANGVDRHRFHPETAARAAAAGPCGGYRVVLGADARTIARTPLTGPGTPTPAPWDRGDDTRAQLVWVGKVTPMKGWDRLEQLAHDLVDVAAITVLLGHSPRSAPSASPVGGYRSPLTVLQDLPEHAVPGLYAAADWLLSTSRWEGFGLAIAEAIAVGTPALLPADLGTAPELLAAGGGHTYRTTAELRQLLTGPRPAGVLPARFDWEANTGATLARYRALLQRDRAARRDQWPGVAR